jgi:hypothetical protein
MLTTFILIKGGMYAGLRIRMFLRRSSRRINQDGDRIGDLHQVRKKGQKDHLDLLIRTKGRRMVR